MTWELTQELEDYIADSLADGISLIKICKQDNMPSRATVLRWQREFPDFDAKCARAREYQGEHAAEMLYDINDKVSNGTLDPAAARVISSNLQWAACKLYSKRYGERKAVDYGNQDGKAFEGNINIIQVPSNGRTDT